MTTPTETKALVERLRALDLYLNNLWSRAATLRDKHTGQAHADLNELRHAIGAIDDVLIPAAQALEPLTREPDADEVERVAKIIHAGTQRFGDRTEWQEEEGNSYFRENCLTELGREAYRKVARAAIAALTEEPGHS